MAFRDFSEMKQVLDKIAKLERDINLLQSQTASGQISHGTSVIPADYSHKHMPSAIRSGNWASSINFTTRPTFNGADILADGDPIGIWADDDATRMGDNANTARVVGTKVFAVQHVDATGKVMPSGEAVGNRQYVQHTDGTNSTPAADVVARSLFAAIGDGTTIAAVSTATSDSVPDLDETALLGVHALLSARKDVDTTIGLTCVDGTYNALHTALTDGTDITDIEGVGGFAIAGKKGLVTLAMVGGFDGANYQMAGIDGAANRNLNFSVREGANTAGVSQSGSDGVGFADYSLDVNAKLYGRDEAANYDRITAYIATSTTDPDLDGLTLLNTHSLVSYRKDPTTTEGATRGTYAVHLEIENLGASTDYILIDLSDTAGFPHTTATSTIHITSMSVSIAGDTSFRGDIELGFLENVDATNGDFHPFETWHIDLKDVSVNDFHNWNFDPLLCSSTYTLVQNISADDVAFQTDVNLTSPLDATTPSGSGDLALRVTRTAGNVDFSVLIKYYVA